MTNLGLLVCWVTEMSAFVELSILIPAEATWIEKIDQLQLLMEMRINAASLPMYSKHLFVSSTILRCTFYPQKKKTQKKGMQKWYNEQPPYIPYHILL